MMKLVVIAGAGAVGLVAFFGLYLFVKGARNVQRAVASPAWPTVAGRVVSADTTRNVARNRKTQEVSVTYSTKTVVEYRVDGQDHATDVMHFGQTLGSGDASEAELQKIRYPVGSEVTVSYDPRAPWIAAVRPGLHAEAFWLPGAGLAFLLPAVLCLTLFPTAMRSFQRGSEADQAFQDAVHRAIEDAQRGIAPPPGPPPAPGGGDNGVMAIAAGVLAGIFCALGILALTSGMQKIWRGYASERWPTAPGEVVSSKAVSESGGYSPQILYQYTVTGAKHFSNVRRFGTAQNQTEEKANEILSRYPVGKRVAVAYFPTDPDVAALEPGNSTDVIWLPAVGLAALLFGAAAMIWIVPAIARGA